MKITDAFSGYSRSNIAACREFYSKVVGLDVKDDMGGIGFKIGQQQVFIYPKQNHEPATYTILNFVVDNIEASVDELVQHGVTFERCDNMPASQDERGIARGKDTGHGPNIAWFKDPSGNILSLVEK